jgi:Domain of unknown function (DUF4365)
MPLQTNDIESELSYAYLHAVASKAGLICKVGNRHDDNYGADALIEYFDEIPNYWRRAVSVKVQLKATINRGAETDTHISYSFRGIKQYDNLRTNVGEPYRILVVLFLPKEPIEWLRVSQDELLLKQAAYWVCLYGADKTENDTGVTIYMPKANLLTPESLIKLCQEMGRDNLPSYTAPRL